MSQRSRSCVEQRCDEGYPVSKHVDMCSTYPGEPWHSGLGTSLRTQLIQPETVVLYMKATMSKWSRSGLLVNENSPALL